MRILASHSNFWWPYKYRDLNGDIIIGAPWIFLLGLAMAAVLALKGIVLFVRAL